LLGLWIRVADAQPQQLAQQQDVVLVPHRATYDMKLNVARPNSGIVEVNGRMVLEMVDSCDAWEVKQRIKLKFLRNDGEEFDTDSSFTSYETKDGLGLRFSVRNIQDQEVEEELRGHADLDATIRRLQAYERAGADVLFAPALPDLDRAEKLAAMGADRLVLAMPPTADLNEACDALAVDACISEILRIQGKHRCIVCAGGVAHQDQSPCVAPVFANMVYCPTHRLRAVA